MCCFFDLLVLLLPSIYKNALFRGPQPPVSLSMITQQHIRELVIEKLGDSESYLVEVNIALGNRITITLDNDNNVGIAECVAVSRWVEHNLDRETDDFSLEVSSPGLDQPFKVFRQYLKNKGREVEVKLLDGTKLEGVLVDADETNGVVLEEQKREKVEGKKTKQLVTRRHEIPFTNLKETKIIIKF